MFVFGGCWRRGRSSSTICSPRRSNLTAFGDLSVRVEILYWVRSSSLNVPRLGRKPVHRMTSSVVILVPLLKTRIFSFSKLKISARWTVISPSWKTFQKWGTLASPRPALAQNILARWSELSHFQLLKTWILTHNQTEPASALPHLHSSHTQHDTPQFS